MRFLMFVKASKDSEASEMPGEKLLVDMGNYNEELSKAGALLAGEGLQPSSKGARVDFSGTDRTVTPGPFKDPEQLVAGFWVIQAGSLEEAIGGAKRVPFDRGQIEVRQIHELEDFPDVPDTVRQQEERLREATEGSWRQNSS